MHRRKALVFLSTFALMVRLMFFIAGVTNNRVFDFSGSPPDIFAFGEVEPFRDYGGAYLPTIEAFKSGYTPYVDFWYVYPPLFLYLLTAFSYLPLGFWGPALPILIFDAFSVVLVYLIGLRFLSEKKSFLVSLLFTLAPINLFYNAHLWLNPPLVTFFALLAAYFLVTERYGLSSLALGVSFGFKQTSLLLFPVSLILAYKKTDLKKALKFIAVCTVVAIIISMPYLFTAPQYYLGCLRVPFVSMPETGPEYRQRIMPPTATGIIQPNATYPVGGNWPINSAFPIFVFSSQGMEGDGLFTYYQSFMGAAVPILNLALFSSFSLLLLKTLRSRDMSGRTVVKYLLLSLILFHSFYGKGIYKYYYAMVTPFLALFMTSRIRCALYILFNLSTLLIPRFLSPWILFPSLIYVALKPYLARAIRFRSDVHVQSSSTKG